MGTRLVPSILQPRSRNEKSSSISPSFLKTNSIVTNRLLCVEKDYTKQDLKRPGVPVFSVNTTFPSTIFRPRVRQDCVEDQVGKGRPRNSPIQRTIGRRSFCYLPWFFYFMKLFER